MTAGEFDNIVAAIYDAAAGRAGWRAALDPLARKFDAWSAKLIGIDKRSNALRFTHEGGLAPPQSALNYLRTYHRINPRIAPMLALDMAQWMHDHECFDEEFVARNRFYQEYAIPQGGRFWSGTKIFDDGQTLVLFGVLRGPAQTPLGPSDIELLDRIKGHLMRALTIHRHLQASASVPDPGMLLLNQFRQPMMVIDDDRGIRFHNQAAEQLLMRAEYVFERGGVLMCRHGRDDSMLSDALRSLRLDDGHQNGLRAPDKKLVRICPNGDDSLIAVFLLALRPQSVVGTFGESSLALLVFHDPKAQIGLDPFIVGEAFDLTPAEARVAVQLAQGRTPEQIGADNSVSIATVRSQIKALFAKTGTNRQTDLVRTLVALPILGTFEFGAEASQFSGGSLRDDGVSAWGAF